MTEETARCVGTLLAAATLDDVVDAAVVESAARRVSSIVTADRGHIERLVERHPCDELPPWKPLVAVLPVEDLELLEAAGNIVESV